MNCLFFGLVCVGLVMLVSSERNTYRFVHVLKEGVEISQDIVHDMEENTVTVVVGDVSMYKGHVATVNYHDFNTGYVVFKDIRRQLCLLSKAPIPFSTPEIYAQGRTDMTLALHSKIDPTLVSHEDVITIAGEKIANFCHDYRTYSRTLTPTGRYRRDREEMKDSDGCHHNCGFCFVSGRASELQSL
ncbi:uncharacterized protein LOC128246769 [Mya arenaria]|uniref:uncharacterized protein LOC128246769 n=1 Tax=Mya arenaria TaxID=6604 RepID=UPI0022DFBDB7|nr:uncharacterized protein LOC128246769 [Mya arenaria]